jgi:hypothetical protein
MPTGIARLLLYLQLLWNMPHPRPSLHLNRDIQSKRTEPLATISADCNRSARALIGLAAQTECRICRDTPRNVFDTYGFQSHVHTNAVQHDPDI